MMKKKESKTVWTKEEVDRLLLLFLRDALSVREAEGVDVGIAFAAFMAKKKLTPDNYPVFFSLLKSDNHWVIDALISQAEGASLFLPVQPNAYMIEEALDIMRTHPPGALYEKTLASILEIIKVAYEAPEAGFRIYELSANDVNQIGKHLDEREEAAAPLNSVILHILDRIAGLHTPGGLPLKNKEAERAAVQANNIRGKFLDPTKRLSDAIPEKLLVPGDYRKTEIAPRRMK